MDDLRDVEAAVPSVHSKIFLGLKKTVRNTMSLYPCTWSDGGTHATIELAIWGLSFVRFRAMFDRPLECRILCLQIYYKLYNLTLPRLRLLKVFLRVMSGEDSDRQLAKIDRMLPGLNNALDMGLVQVLSWCVCRHLSGMQCLHFEKSVKYNWSIQLRIQHDR